MATTTPNYGWTVPTSTDLVKDGATAIETLGDAIDASMNTALGTKKAGMVLLNTTSFSAVASQSFNNVFSATYDTYLINGIFDTSTSTDIRYRYRVSGADNSTANSYISARFINYDPSTSASQVTTDSFAEVVGGVNTQVLNFTMTIYNPFATRPTYADVSGVRESNTLMARSGIRHNQSTSYDGITFIPSAGTITGSIKVYGYNK
jgi:hypothetical protein